MENFGTNFPASISVEVGLVWVEVGLNKFEVKISSKSFLDVFAHIQVPDRSKLRVSVSPCFPSPLQPPFTGFPSPFAAPQTRVFRGLVLFPSSAFGFPWSFNLGHPRFVTCRAFSWPLSVSGFLLPSRTFTTSQLCRSPK